MNTVRIDYFTQYKLIGYGYMCADSLPTDGEKVSSTHVPVVKSLATESRDGVSRSL